MDEITAALRDYYLHQVPVLAVSFPILLLPFIILERLRPVGRPPSWRDYLFNFSISISTAIVAGPIGTFAVYLSKETAKAAHLPNVAFSFSDIGIGNATLDPILTVIAMIALPLIVHDCWFYWSHRLEHKIKILWSFHQLHHSDPNMNASTYARDHILQTIWRSFFSMFTLGLLLDIQFEQAAQAALLSNIFLAFLSQFYHSAVRIHLPWLDKFLVTPQLHRIHHSALAEHRDKNFADVFPLFDIIFGTYRRPAADEFPPTGLSVDAVSPSSWYRAQWLPIKALFSQ